MSEKKTITLADAKDLMSIIPFYMDEYQDVEEICDNYTKSISPLLAGSVVSSSPTPTSLKAITTAAPLYVKSSSNFITSRDPAEINVHSALQSEFWQTLFRDCFGSELNALAVAAFNRLRHVYVTEENLLFSSVFKKLLTTGTDSEMPLYFNEDDDGSLKIVRAKLDAAYALLHYEASYSSFIDSWLDSMYLSGQLSLSEKLHEANVYAAQDIRAELLRRKFAGTASLYSIALSAINRRGTYAPTVPLKSVYQDANFKDNRYVRALDLPGITTNASDVSIDPLTAFSEDIPLRTLMPLYYTSANYDSEEFTNSPADFLRHRTAIFAWDNIRGILDSSLVKRTFPKLDQTNAATATMYQLDRMWEEDNEMRTAILDDSRPLFDLSVISSGFFDIQADQLLYHENTLQKARRHEYPYLTYHISGDTGPCMMDVPWLDYIERAISRKKRVQESVGIGVQISKFATASAQLVEESCTVITFSTDLTKDYSAQSSTFQAGMRYAYLWNLRIFYNIYSFEVERLDKELISYMLLAVNSNSLSAQTIAAWSSHPSYNLFITRTSGLIPFAYQNLRTEAILSLELRLNNTDGLVDDFYEEEYNKAVFLFTPYENVAIAKRYIRTEPGTLIGSGEWFTTPESDEALKHVIYGVSRENEETGATEWYWSDPMRLYPKEVANLKYYHPDWMGMVMYVNPYLSLTKECASPIRRLELAPRALRGATTEQPIPEAELGIQYGPGENVAIGNLNVLHGMHIFCNDTGSAADDNYPRGSYLRKIRPAIAALETESFQIWGDNRPIWDSLYAEDPLDDWDNNLVRTAKYGDAKDVPCLKLAEGEAYAEGTAVDSYYLISPGKTATLEPGWKDWLWNSTDNNGFTVCVDLEIQDLAVDQWLLSRNELPSGTDIHAELDFYYSAAHELVLKVYPTGIQSDLELSVSLAAEHITEKQSQIAASYFYEVDEENSVKLNITMSIVADRKWATKYYSTVKLSDTQYELYETAEDFLVDELTPTIIDLQAGYSYAEGYSLQAPYLFGKLPKYQAQATNLLGNVRMLNFRDGYYPMRGLLYDYRLMNKGVTVQELIILAAGTRRELYSYSPSLYKLSYQHFTDAGVLKRFRRASESASESPGRIRIFERSVWDSILVELYPLAEEEIDIFNPRYRADFKDPLDDADIYDGFDYKAGVIDRRLVSGYEVLSDVTIANGTEIYYRGEPVYTEATDKHSFIQTSIYPIEYKDEAFTSDLVLKRDTSVLDAISLKAYHHEDSYLPAGAHSADIASTPSGDTLVYKLSLDLNFLLQNEVDAAAPMVRGSNILVDYDSALSTFVVKHDIPSSTMKAVTKNHLVYPLYIANQGAEENSSAWSATLAGFEISNFKLSSALSTLLNARSYYGEMQVPYAYEDALAATGFSYTSRWSAVKGLRDGEYYITCKYPVQILPLSNHEQALTTKAPVLYMASRLKIVIASRPKYYVETKVSTYMPSWDAATFKPKEYVPEDNRSFPHREVDIDLYVMKNTSSVSETWVWQKIASNHDEASGVELINDASNSLALEAALNFYFTKNFTAPFFVQGETTEDVVSDILKVGITNVKGDENLEATSLAEMDTLVLKSSRAYKVLVDYSASISELSYSAEIFTDTSLASETMSVEEKANYTKLVSLLDIVNPQYNGQNALKEVAYTSRLDWSAAFGEDFNLASTKTGYVVTSAGEWQAISTDVVANDLAMGDPYSNASSKNLLVDTYENSRELIASLFYFTYRQEDISIDTVIPPQLFGTDDGNGEPTVPYTVKKVLNRGYTLEAYNLDEYDVLASLYDQKIRAVKESLSEMVNSAGGILSAFAKIDPLLISVGNLQLTESITPSTHKFSAYKMSSFSVNLVAFNNAISRKGLYSTNLVASQDYLDAALYDIGPASGEYVFDAAKARDVFAIAAGTGTEVTLHYLGDPGSSSQYEIAVSLNSPVLIEAAVQCIAPRTGAVLWTSAYEAISAIDTWEVLSWETPANTDPASIKILIRQPESAAFASQDIKLSKLFIRKARNYSHVDGFSEAVLASANATTLGSSKPSIAGALSVGFSREDTATFFPLQFRNTLLGLTPKPTFLSYATKASTFIAAYVPTASLSSTSELVTLIRPWTRKIVFKEDSPRKVSIFKLSNGLNGVDFSKAGGLGDIFEVHNDYENEADRTIRFNALYNDVEFAGLKGLVLNTARALEVCDVNLQVVTSDIPVTEERFSLVTGCVNPERFIAGESSVVGITNIQIMDNDEEDPAILYEIEYLPIIYDESRHHFSVNFLLRAN